MPGPVSMITAWPPAMTAVQASARLGSGIGDPVPHSRICRASSLNTAALSALAIWFTMARLISASCTEGTNQATAKAAAPAASSTQTAMIRRLMHSSLAPGRLHTLIPWIAGNDNSGN